MNCYSVANRLLGKMLALSTNFLNDSGWTVYTMVTLAR